MARGARRAHGRFEENTEKQTNCGTLPEISAMEYLKQLSNTWDEMHKAQKYGECALCGRRFVKKVARQKYCPGECGVIAQAIHNRSHNAEKGRMLLEKMSDFMRQKREKDEE